MKCAGQPRAGGVYFNDYLPLLPGLKKRDFRFEAQRYRRNYVDPAVKDKLQVNLKLSSQSQISSLRVTIANADTGITIRDFATLPVGPQVTLDVSGLPGGSYNVTVYAYDANGTQLSSNTQKFNYDYVAPTATPTPTPLPCPRPARPPTGCSGAAA